MAYKNVRRHACHHITQKPASHTCYCSQKNKKKCMFNISLTDSRIHSHHCKNSKTDRIHHEHYFIVMYTKFTLKQFFFLMQHKKHNARSNRCHNCIHGMLKYTWRNNAEYNVTNHSSSYGGHNTKHADSEYVHFPPHSNHSTGRGKSHRSYHFHYKGNYPLIIHCPLSFYFISSFIILIIPKNRNFENIFPANLVQKY